MTSPRAEASPLPVVIETKLWPPLVRDRALPRTELVEALEERISSHAVTVLSAGAGFGKTSLLAAWFASRPVPEAIAWVTLDAADNDPVRFWAHVGEALRRTYRDRLESAAEPLPTSAPDTVATLVNELAAIRAPRVLVLDDFHLVSNLACADSLDAFVAAMPPKTRLVVSSRADPPISLARLRATGALGELRARELAYTNAEARELVERTPEARLGSRDAERLRRRTDGWPAGMYLALLAAADHEDAHAFVERFAGDTHTVADYLGAEVLSHLDEPTLSFLVRTSVLGELSGPLCDVALATTGSAERLRELERSNLFLVPLDDRREWFRYHQLFRDLLRFEFGQLDAETRADVHRRASGWYATVGGRPALAIEHAIAAGDWEEAAALVERTALDAAQKGRWVTIFGWISGLPEEALLGRPLLPALGGSIATSMGVGWAEVERWLRLCEESRRRVPERWTPEAEAFASYPRAAFVGTDVGSAVVAAARHLEASAQAGLGAEAITHGTLAWALFLVGDLERAADEAERALAHEEGSDWAGGSLQGNTVLSLLAAEAGDAERALALARLSSESARELDFAATPVSAQAHVALALALALDGKLEQAEDEATLASGVEGPPRDASRKYALIALASIQRRRGRFARARETLDAVERGLHEFADPGRLPELLAAERSALAAAEAASGGIEELSDAELPVLRQLATGLSLREIASALFLSQNTVKTHCRSIYRKLEVGSRADAVARARDLGLLDDSPG